MKITERAFNILVGLSVISWAALGPATAKDGDAFTPVRLVTSGLNLCVGILFIVRSPVTRHGSLASIALSLPGVMVAGLALRLAPAPSAWPMHSELLFTCGGLLAIVSFIFLGRSFAVLPAVRGIVSSGPYRVVRHPAYLGELMLVLACFTADPGLWPSIPLILAVPLVVLRIIAEERVLSTGDGYPGYRTKVRRRLVPFVW